MERKHLNNIEKKKFQERCSWQFLNEYSNNCSELPQNSRSASMEALQARSITHKDFKGPKSKLYETQILYRSPKLTHKKYNLYVHFRNIIKFANKSLKSLEAHLWN